MTTTTATQLWKAAHPKANVPSVITDREDLIDTSWRNDAMPSFQVRGHEEGQIDIRLWVDYEDKTLSEMPPECGRYMVSRQDWDKMGNEAEEIYNGNDPLVALTALYSTVSGEPAPITPEIERNDAIAAEFVKRLAQHLSPDEMQKAANRNATEANKSICHTHDFCDANEAMAEAFTFVVGREPDTGEEADCVIWNDAWSKAKVLLQVQYPPNNEATMQAVVANLKDGLGYPASYEYPGYISIMGLAFGIDGDSWTGNVDESCETFRGEARGNNQGLDMVALASYAPTDVVVAQILLCLSRHLATVAHRIAGPVGH